MVLNVILIQKIQTSCYIMKGPGSILWLFHSKQSWKSKKKKSDSVDYTQLTTPVLCPMSPLQSSLSGEDSYRYWSNETGE